MKVLSAEQMREVDRLTIERGIPGLILMENAAHRVVEFLQEQYAPLGKQHIAVLCGKGNNGGDGLAMARLLFTRFHPRRLDVVLTSNEGEYRGDALENLRMLGACGCAVRRDLGADLENATLVIDAVLGTGLKGPASGEALAFVEAINSRFPWAKVVAVDLPSGMNSDEADTQGVVARADGCVTFTAPKLCHALAPNCDRVGVLRVGAIGSPASLVEDNPDYWLSVVEPRAFAHLFRPRARDAHKGDFGHVLVVGGAVGKTGAVAMTGMAALRGGAGLVTVATPAEALPGVAAHGAELMTEPLAVGSYAALESLSERKTLLAVGPGMGTSPEAVGLVREIYTRHPLPAILDADAINGLAGVRLAGTAPRVLTPHPGEMARLTGTTTEAVQADRIGIARRTAMERGITIVLKGQRTLIAFADGRVLINPTGTPAMATAGSGDILTGLMAGLCAQFPEQMELAVVAAVWLHGRAGEHGAVVMGEKSLIATDLLKSLPEAMRELALVEN